MIKNSRLLVISGSNSGYYLSSQDERSHLLKTSPLRIPCQYTIHLGSPSICHTFQETIKNKENRKYLSLRTYLSSVSNGL